MYVSSPTLACHTTLPYRTTTQMGLATLVGVARSQICFLCSALYHAFRSGWWVPPGEVEGKCRAEVAGRLTARVVEREAISGSTSNFDASDETSMGKRCVGLDMSLVSYVWRSGELGVHKQAPTPLYICIILGSAVVDVTCDIPSVSTKHASIMEGVS